jgi:hypothetical protein
MRLQQGRVGEGRFEWLHKSGVCALRGEGYHLTAQGDGEFRGKRGCKDCLWSVCAERFGHPTSQPKEMGRKFEGRGVARIISGV